MTERLEMPIEQFAEAVAKENSRLNKKIEQLEAALRSLLETHDEDVGMDEYSDDESVGWNGDGSNLPLTFGILRKARAALAGEKKDD